MDTPGPTGAVYNSYFFRTVVLRKRSTLDSHTDTVIAHAVAYPSIWLPTPSEVRMIFLIKISRSYQVGVGGIVVSIAAFQAVDQGSIPGQRTDFIFLFRLISTIFFLYDIK